MPIGIEDLFRARQVHNISLHLVLLVSLLPALLAVIFSVLLTRGREASLMARFVFIGLLFGLNLAVGALALVLAVNLLALIGVSVGDGWLLYFASVIVVAVVDFILWLVLIPEGEDR